ncbi:MAG: NHL repeat-containing protein [Pirellulaceae bacterium]
MISRSRLRVWAAAASLVVMTTVVVAAPRASIAQELQYPVGVAAAQDGTIFIADRNFHGIWKFSNGKLEKFFEGSAKFRTPLNAVRCLAIDHQGKLLAGDSATREVYRFDETGNPVPLTQGKIGIPTAIAVRKSGEILVADQELMFIWKIAAEGGEPVKLAEVAGIVGLCLDQEDQLWVTSRSAIPLRRIRPDGQVENVLSERTFQFPQQIVVDDTKTAYIADNYDKAVWKVPAGGAPVKLVDGDPLVGPVGIARAGDKLLITDPKAKALFQVEMDGKVTRLVPGA